MDKLKEITLKRKKAHAKLVALKSPVYQAFLEMEQAAYSDGALPKRTKEPVAVGISVVIDCESCMQWHIEQAAQAGATMRVDVPIAWAAVRRRYRPGSRLK